MCLGLPGQVEEIFEEDGLSTGRVRFAGVARSVCLELGPSVTVGDDVIVHVGFALSPIDSSKAARLSALLSELDDEPRTEAPSRANPSAAAIALERRP